MKLFGTIVNKRNAKSRLDLNIYPNLTTVMDICICTGFFFTRKIYDSKLKIFNTIINNKYKTILILKHTLVSY